MNLLNRIMSYDKTKNENQENCNCAECIGNAEISKKRELLGISSMQTIFLPRLKIIE